ncbi:ABC transporter ATP-binding protein [Rhodoplanes roseus]|uniref:ABC transporter n=1 Tax=Rhodoplanes roseus TaxID=29409 RepID=A0A327KXN7_9BRAD|nr:ABC transporter ATP-binding protein [Rhodoplanes roseus]RAI43640.1 ABC transporter [Rhodoplanes roseus]
MDDLCRYADRPLAFLFRYVRMRPAAHAFILIAVLVAVGCSVATQYGIKVLVDSLAPGPSSNGAWLALGFMVALIAADNLLWRIACWVASSTFVGVTGDLRRDLFRHLTGHAPSYFSDRLPGMLTSRVTATSNAVFTIENMVMWNVLPPCVATVGAVVFVATVDWTMAAGLVAVAAVIVAIMIRLAAAGRPLHHAFADKAAAVDGEMIDVIGNMSLVKMFCGLGREHRRFDDTLDREMTARRRSLRYLERIRLFHAVVTIVLTVGLLAWAVLLWQRGAATAGQVVLVGTLGLSILNATRDLAVALVDVTQHMARLSEALATMLVPHVLRDHPQASTLVRNGASVTFEGVSFGYPGGRPVFDGLHLVIAPGQRVGLVGRSGSGKSTVFALLQRFYDVQGGRILIDGQDIARVTQESLRASIAVVPQDVSMFNRTIRENIRYGRPDATDEEVWQAAEAARCTEFIAELPAGLDTPVGDRGVKLSGGQRQRIAIARAFLKDAPILLLDEATSALDVESEEAIREALARLMTGRTVLAIAHRLSTVSNFDRILVFRDGEIVQDGAPGHLLRRPGLYRDLIDGELSRLEMHPEAA